MKCKYLLIFSLLMFPALSIEPCFEVNLTPPSDTQGNRSLEISVRNVGEDLMRLKSIELYFSEAQNVSVFSAGTCAKEQLSGAGRLCEMIFWEPSTELLADAEYVEKIWNTFCLQEGRFLTAKAAATAECPVPYFKQLNYTEHTYSKNSVVCTPHQSMVGGAFENLTTWVYFKSYGGSGRLTLLHAGGSTTLAEFDPFCEEHPCGEYININASLPSHPYIIQLCANTTNSEIDIANLTSIWKFFNYEVATVWDNKTIEVEGYAELKNDFFEHSPIMVGNSTVIYAGLGATCGIASGTISAKSRNSTVAYLVPYTESPKQQLFSLQNNQLKLFSWEIYANQSGATDFEFVVTSGKITKHYLSEELEVEENPYLCPANYTYCGGECKLNPGNCSQECATGGTLCRDGQVFCELLLCGTSCPHDESKVCDGVGSCIVPPRELWNCDCDASCVPAYMEAGQCLYNAVCTGVCEYSKMPCNATCLPSGCCGDGVCSPTESCTTCIEDCSCDDGDPCTDDICSLNCVHVPSKCGTKCPGGICDGMGNCKPDICCKDEDCLSDPCKEGTCENFTCQLNPLSCVPCPEGFCYEGECLKLRFFKQECECPNACAGSMVCKNGVCSYCGNDVCDAGECQTCPQDCTKIKCPATGLLEIAIQLGVIAAALIALLAVFKVI